MSIHVMNFVAPILSVKQGKTQEELWLSVTVKGNEKRHLGLRNIVVLDWLKMQSVQVDKKDHWIR